jgi:hypothetical protein
MKRLFQVLFGLMLSVALFTACEGPAGAKGDPGTGAPGKDASLTCTACHGNSNVNFKFAQYDLSRHNLGIVYEEEAGRYGCGGCHSGDGFAEAAAAGTDDPTTRSASKINCMACHPIHTKFDTTDFALRVTTPVTLRIGGAVVDFKTGNLCAKCHQGRTYVSVFGADTTFKHKTASTSTYTRYGPHYGTPANVFSMNGLYNVAGTNTIPTTNKHGNLAKGCVSCHMGSLSTNPATGGHQFQMAPTSFTEMATTGECKTCHSAADFAATALPVKVAVTKALADTKALLIAKGFLDISQTKAADGTYQILGEYIAQNNTGITMTKAQIEVALNYLYLAKDRSFGAHNPQYVLPLLKNGIEVLNK